ncbi:uncharacterized protein LOC132721570 [Ruditapes philippinarum]|uniref:uncharacterized protein LOC132721570 n=1 Tax=Ruditapes philippinarum TaxID=129788 RepID=UPI00295BB5B5|nr:uncharacterized protein LOC132721570 [Ruditapes philippinarum]
MENNVCQCQAWLLSEGRLTPETQAAKFTHEGGSVQATPDNAPSVTRHSTGTSHSPTDRLPDTGGYFTSARPDSAHYTTSRWPGFAQSTIKHKPNIENFNDSKLIKQQISVNTDEDVKDHTVKNTARDRPKTFNMQNVNVPARLNISYEYDNKTLVCKFDTKAGIEVHIYTGNIISLQNIEAVVCSENKAGNAKGIVATLLLKNGGEEYLQDKATKFSYIPAFGDIVTTTGGRNSYMWIIHAIMPRREPQAICAMYRKIFEEVAERRFISVSLPLLGTGVGDVDPRTCTEMLLNELIQFCQKQRWQKLSLHIVSNDELVCDIVKDVFTKTIDEMNTIEKPTKPEDDFVLNNITDESSDDGEI